MLFCVTNIIVTNPALPASGCGGNQVPRTGLELVPKSAKKKYIDLTIFGPQIRKIADKKCQELPGAYLYCISRLTIESARRNQNILKGDRQKVQ
jgi:hypothetical protein